MKDKISFEIFSPDSSNAGYMKFLGKRVVENDVWNHYSAVLGPDEYRNFIAESCGVEPKHASVLTASLFDKVVRHTGKPRIMGIVNATPDSFYPGSRFGGNSLNKLEKVLEEGPDIVDVGGESTRPGSNEVSVEEEIRRLKPVLDYLSSSYNIPISLDTRNPETVEFALRYGIKYLNDVSGFSDPEMISIAAENSLECIAMHMRGEPRTMQKSTEYDDLIFEMNLFLSDRTRSMIQGGIDPSRIIIDPGIGFAKGLKGNLEIIRELQSFNSGFRILVGHSRKTFIGKLTGEEVSGRLAGTLGVSVYLMMKKADILRVHDVKENREVLDVYSSIEDNFTQV